MAGAVERAEAVQELAAENFIKFKSEYNMSELDIFRIDRALRWVDEYAMLCGCLQYQYLLPYLQGLRVVYSYIQTLIQPRWKEAYDAAFRGIEDRIVIRGENNRETFIRVRSLHDKLMLSRQICGLGVMARREKKFAENYLKPEYQD